MWYANPTRLRLDSPPHQPASKTNLNPLSAPAQPGMPLASFDASSRIVIFPRIHDSTSQPSCARGLFCHPQGLMQCSIPSIGGAFQPDVQLRDG